MEGTSGDEFTPSVEEPPPVVPIFPDGAPDIPIVEDDPAVSPGPRPRSPSLPSANYSLPEESPIPASPSPARITSSSGTIPEVAPSTPWGIGANRGSLRPPVGGPTNEEQLIIRSLRFEAERRWRESAAAGFISPRVDPSEPLPLLSHVLGVPPVSSMWDSISAAVTVPGHVVRALGDPAVDIGAGPIGTPGLAAPSEWEPPTPVIRQVSTARYPEKEAVRPLMVDASVQTQSGLDDWERWLDRTLQGKSLEEFGLCGRDLKFALELLDQHPPPPRSAKAAWKSRHAQADPCPRGVFPLEVSCAWKVLEAALYKHMSEVHRKQEEKASRAEMRAAIRSSQPKVAPGPPKLPSSSASSSSEELELQRGELEALGRVKGTKESFDRQVWATMESMVGFSLAGMANYVPAPAGEGGPAPKSPGAASSSSLAPGQLVANHFHLPMVPPPVNLAKNAEILKELGVPTPPAVPPRSRLPTPPRAKEVPSAAAPVATGQTSKERAFTLSSPTAPVEHSYEATAEGAQFSEVASQACQVIEEGQRLLEEPPLE
ncbi:amtB [Symbiodinium sp. CCMP2592]|nr:amtB [Symbiodinium sp. CCMP2592]